MRGSLPQLYVSNSDIHGLGLFAGEMIVEETYIGRYEGPVTSENDMHVLWVWDETEEKWLGIDGDNELRYLNHSDRPNAEFYDTELYALREIEQDEEITFDYQWD